MDFRFSLLEKYFRYEHIAVTFAMAENRAPTIFRDDDQNSAWYGKGGDDLFISTGGADFMHGKGGDDTFILSAGEDAMIRGGRGHDRLAIETDTDLTRTDLYGNVFTLSDGDMTITVKGVEDVDIYLI